MSYEVVKNLSIKKDGRCFIESASNNVVPRTYYKGEIFKSLDHDETVVACVEQILSGNLQPSNSQTKIKLFRTVYRLRHNPEFKDKFYKFRKGPVPTKEWPKVVQLRKDKYSEYKKLILDAYNYKPEKGPFIIKSSGPYYIRRTKRGTAIITHIPEYAKMYNKEDAELIASRFTDVKIYRAININGKVYIASCEKDEKLFNELKNKSKRKLMLYTKLDENKYCLSRNYVRNKLNLTAD